MTNAPDLRAALRYSGSGNLTLTVSPLSEMAYQLADTHNGNLDTLANALQTQTLNVTQAFGLSGVDITRTLPTDLNTRPVKMTMPVSSV